MLLPQSHGLDQYAMRKFAEALEVIPRILAENSGQDASATITALYAAHEKGNTNVGVDIDVRPFSLPLLLCAVCWRRETRN